MTDSDSSLSREREYSSSSPTTYTRHRVYNVVGVKGEEERKKEDTDSLSFKNFEDLLEFLKNKKKLIFSLHYLSKNQTTLEIMSEVGAFTKTSIKEYCSEFGHPVAPSTIKRILEILDMMGVVDCKMIETTLLPAEIYYFPCVEHSEKRFRKMVARYTERWEKTNPKLKKSKKKKRISADELKEIWKEQSIAAKELKKEQQEANTCKRLLTQGVTCASQFQKKYWCEVCLEESA